MHADGTTKTSRTASCCSWSSSPGSTSGTSTPALSAPMPTRQQAAGVVPLDQLRPDDAGVRSERLLDERPGSSSARAPRRRGGSRRSRRPRPAAAPRWRRGRSQGRSRAGGHRRPGGGPRPWRPGSRRWRRRSPGPTGSGSPGPRERSGARRNMARAAVPPPPRRPAAPPAVGPPQSPEASGRVLSGRGTRAMCHRSRMLATV